MGVEFTRGWRACATVRTYAQRGGWRKH